VKILAVDTALGACSAALVENDSVIASDWREMVRGHAETLAPMVDALMRGAGVAFASLDRLAVTTGPGTFTGQRVGLAFMRALALALKKPLIGVTTLDAMAEAALSEDESAEFAIAAADAKRGEIYLGARSRSGTLLEPMLTALEEAPSQIRALSIKGSVVLAGTAAEMLAPLLEAGGYSPRDSGIRQPDARYVALLARSMEPGPPPKPLYLRAPDAKLPAGVP
jgi:tRNA threonylcarbamoyladenosine biosynthesis protein TsaB